jgi:hypothetical protein
MWTGDAPLPSNPEYPEVDLVCADVFDSYGRMLGSVWRVYEKVWRIRRTSKNAALIALRADVTL